MSKKVNGRQVNLYCGCILKRYGLQLGQVMVWTLAQNEGANTTKEKCELCGYFRWYFPTAAHTKRWLRAIRKGGTK